MYYLRFVSEECELNISCFQYRITQKDGWQFVTTETRDSKGLFESNFCVGDGQDFCSLFIMNINGQTLDKIVSHSAMTPVSK